MYYDPDTLPHPPPDLPLEGGGTHLNPLSFRGRVRVGVDEDVARRKSLIKRS